MVGRVNEGKVNVRGVEEGEGKWKNKNR